MIEHRVILFCQQHRVTSDQWGPGMRSHWPMRGECSAPAPEFAWMVNVQWLERLSEQGEKMQTLRRDEHSDGTSPVWKPPEPWTINELNGETKTNRKGSFLYNVHDRRMMISSKCFTNCIRQTRLLNIEQSLKFKDHHFTMKQSTAPLYRGWYGCDLVKFGEMLTAKRTCAVAIGVFKTPLKRNVLIKMNQHTKIVTEMQSEWCWQIGRGLNYQDTRRQCLLCLHPTTMPLFITLY